MSPGRKRERMCLSAKGGYMSKALDGFNIDLAKSINKQRPLHLSCFGGCWVGARPNQFDKLLAKESSIAIR